MARLAISFSRGIRDIRGIDRLLGVDRVLTPSDSWSYTDEVAVVVWGRKETSQVALKFAKKMDLPVLYLEDGFVRTCSSDAHSRVMYSLIVDADGVYYDSTQASALEKMLNAEDADFDEMFSTVETELTQACLEIMTEYNVTKYNFCTDYQPTESKLGQNLVLVIDQTVGDASVIFGGMTHDRFRLMLDCAIAENPDSTIVVKSHPDVVAGIKAGYLATYAKSRNVQVISEPVNPLSLLKCVDRVYVGTSQMGMEALMVEKPVTVFGKPFYAGWGLTDDRSEIPGRTANRTLQELFFAAYLWYPRYCNPVTGEIWSLPECLEHVLLQKKQFTKNARHHLCVGITPWKRRYIQAYLRSPGGSVSFRKRMPRLSAGQSLKKKSLKDESIVTWGYGKIAPDVKPAMPLLRVEDGFLRSSGLGSDYNAPSSLVLDDSGLYFNPGQPSKLEILLNTADCQLEDTWRARRLINLILSAKLSKYNIGEKNSVNLIDPAGINKTTILVVGQVETDASIRYGCKDIRTNTALLEAVREENSEAWILYKAHPDVEAGNRQGAVSDRVLSSVADQVLTDTDIISAIEATDELHTMTSLAGFEALIREKKVVTYGMPFYAGWGLTRDLQGSDSRSRRRTLEELVYFSLIEYPTYLDILTGEFTSPENLITRIGTRGMTRNKMTWSERQISKIYNICKGLSYEP